MPSPAKKTATEAKVTAASSAPKAESSVKTPRIKQNGVARPNSGTTTARVWSIADELSKKTGVAAERKDVLAVAASEGINPATATTQFGAWCKFHGLAKPREAKVAEKSEAVEDIEDTVEDIEDTEEEIEG